MRILAHGVGQSQDLPLPLDLVLQAGAATVVVSFLVVAVWWQRPRLGGGGERPDQVSERPSDRGGWRPVARVLVLLAALYLVGNALAGPRGPGNPAAHALFAWLWVGLVPVSVVFGPVWREINPLRTLFRLLRLPAAGLRPVAPDKSAGRWPASLALLAFVWLELVAPHRSDPVVVGCWLVGYGLVQLACAILRGEEWFARGDCFEVYSDLAGRLSPLSWREPQVGQLDHPRHDPQQPVQLSSNRADRQPGQPSSHGPDLQPSPHQPEPQPGQPSSRRPDLQPSSHRPEPQPGQPSPHGPDLQPSLQGAHPQPSSRTPDPRLGQLGRSRPDPQTKRLHSPRWRNPLAGVARTPTGPGLAAFLAVWWGSTIADSASGSPPWAALVQRTDHPLLTGTIGLVLLCAMVLVSVRKLSGHLDLTASLIPIAVGYTLAHYLSLLLVEGPRGALLLVQQWGWVEGVHWDLVPLPGVIAAAQIALILVGHVLAVIVAHDLALTAAPRRPVLATLADELPVVLLMIGYTWAGLFLLFVR